MITLEMTLITKTMPLSKMKTSKIKIYLKTQGLEEQRKKHKLLLSLNPKRNLSQSNKKKNLISQAKQQRQEHHRNRLKKESKK